MIEGLEQAISDLDIQTVRASVDLALKKGHDASKMLDALKTGVVRVGEKFETGEYFLSELIVAGEILKESIEKLKPYLEMEKLESHGKIVIGTIEGDLHDIGKEIVKSLLISAGFDVYDLGVDVPPVKFVAKALETGAPIIGISALLTTVLPRAAEVDKELRKAGIRSRVKVIVGGAATRDWMAKKYGIDATTDDAVKGVQIIKSWVK